MDKQTKELIIGGARDAAIYALDRSGNKDPIECATLVAKAIKAACAEAGATSDVESDPASS